MRAPVNWFTGKKSRSYAVATIKPITGDGGAKLHLNEENELSFMAVSSNFEKN